MMKKIFYVIAFGLIIGSPYVFAAPVSTSIPAGVSVYSFVFKQFDEADLNTMLDNGENEKAIKALAQAAFEAFKVENGGSAMYALEKLKTLVNDLYDETNDRASRIRIRTIEAVLDGVGEGEHRWYG